MEDAQYQYKKMLILLGDEDLGVQFSNVNMLYSFEQHKKAWGRLIRDIGLKGTIGAMANFLPCVQYIHEMPLSRYFFHPIYTEEEIAQKILIIQAWLEEPSKSTKEELGNTIRWFEDIHIGHEPVQASENFLDYIIMAITGRGKFHICILNALDTLKKLGFPKHIIESEFRTELKKYVREKFA